MNSHFKKILLLLLVVYTADVFSQSTMLPPAAIPWPSWAENVVNVHLTNMTAEIMKDAMLKFAMTKSIQDGYKGSITYELGVLAASIQNLFQRNVVLYRQYSNLTNYRLEISSGDSLSVEMALNAFHIAQSNYNRMRLEQNIFNTIKAEHEDKVKKMQRDYKNKYPQLNKSKFNKDMSAAADLPLLRSPRRMADAKTNETVREVKEKRKKEVERILFPDKHSGDMEPELEADGKTDFVPRRNGAGKSVWKGHPENIEYEGVGLPVLITERTTKKRLWRPKF